VSGVQYIGLGQLAIAALLIVFSGIVSFALQLKLEKQLAIGAVRTIVQLMIVGYVLKYVFVMRDPFIIAALIAVMVGFASHAAVGRSKNSYPGIRVQSFITLIASGVLTSYVVTSAIIQVHPWYRPQYLIPLLGMILGNSLTGISIALDQLLTDLTERTADIEMELAHGATAWEAARVPLHDAVRRGMIPTINGMMVVGIVSLPGMMTGQILAGSDPVDAVKYQIVVMFMLSAATALGCMMITLLAYRRLFNKRHQLERALIVKREK
jgi:putative ABC transport system permease protein